MAGTGRRHPLPRSPAALLPRCAAGGEIRVVAVPAGDAADPLRELADLFDQSADPRAFGGHSAADRADSVAPSRTLETAGVLEATLFDVRSGTILFTLYERVHARSDETPWDDDRKLRAMKLRLLEQAGGRLAEQVVSKVRHLSALRQAKERKSVAAQAGPAPPG